MVKRTRYCGGPSIGLWKWLRAGGASTNSPAAWPQLQDRQVITTFRGRTAAALACRLLGIGTGHEVLVPSYNCGTELDAIRHSGARLVGYQVSRHCRIDLNDLEARRTDRTRAVYIIHYFGWEQPVQELRQWCDQHGLLLIEDCALALFSDGPSGAIGRMGDAAIFSLPKTLGSWHGGLLSLPASHTKNPPELAPAGFSTLLKEFRNSVRAAAMGALARTGLYGTVLTARRRLRDRHAEPEPDANYPRMPDDYYFNPEAEADRALHPRLWALAGSLPVEEIIRRRRRNYLHLADALEGLADSELLFPDLPAGVCPLSLPLLVPDRDSFVRELQARGIAALPWWAGYHLEGLDWSRFPEAARLKRHILSLPVHQNLSDSQLKYVAETVTRLRENGRTQGKASP